MLDVFRQDLTVTRQQPGQYVDGIFQPGTTETLTVRASVQPVSPDDVQLLPEGKRNRQAFTLYSDAEINVADDQTTTAGDRVDIDGDTYQATARQPWQNSIIPHYRTVVVKEADQ